MEQPILSVNEVRDLLGISYPAANTLVERLISLGILDELTGQARNRRFQYAAYRSSNYPQVVVSVIPFGAKGLAGRNRV